MMKAPATLWTVILVGCAFGLYQVKYQVEELRTRLHEVRTELRETEEAVHVLNAEWAFLTRHDRIESLAVKHLAMQPVAAERIVALKDIRTHFVPVPQRKPEPEAPQSLYQASWEEVVP